MNVSNNYLSGIIDELGSHPNGLQIIGGPRLCFVTYPNFLMRLAAAMVRVCDDEALVDVLINPTIEEMWPTSKKVFLSYKNVSAIDWQTAATKEIA